MVVVGIILLLIALLIAGAPTWLLPLAIILIVVGLVLNFVPVGGTRRRYY